MNRFMSSVKFCKKHQNPSLMFQNSTRPHKAPAATCPTKAVRIKCYCSSLSIVSPRQVWCRHKKMLALNLLARSSGATVSNGVLRPNRSSTTLMKDKRTPAKRRERHWWRNVTGKENTVKAAFL